MDNPYLKTKPPLVERTMQDWFDIAWDWAVTNEHPQCINPVWLGAKFGSKARTNEVKCLYRSPDNDNACLIGAGLTDDEFNICKFQNGVDLTAQNAGYFLPELKLNIQSFLNTLQCCHDQVLSEDNYIEKVKENLIDLADRYELEIPGEHIVA